MTQTDKLTCVGYQANEENFTQLYQRIQRDFTYIEILPQKKMRQALLEGQLKAVFLEDDHHTILAYAVFSLFSGGMHLIYFSVEPSLRSQGIGTVFLKKLLDLNLQASILLEVENPAAGATEAERELRQRRIRFYERAGFRVLPFRKVSIFGKDSQLMCKSDTQRDWRDILLTSYAQLWKKNGAFAKRLLSVLIRIR